MMEKCAKCGEYMVFPKSHSCKPIWEVQIEEYHGDEYWSEVRAYDEEGAVEEFAERYDQDGEYSIVSGHYEPEIKVRKPGAKEYKIFNVYGESVSKYYASEKERGAK